MIAQELMYKPKGNIPSHSPYPKEPVFELNPNVFRTQFNQTPYLIRHHVADHPAWQLARLIELAKRLPAEFVEYNAGNIPVSIDSNLTPRNGLSIEETIRRIEDHCSWMVLKRVEQDPEYKKILDGCLDEVQELSEPLDPGMYDRAGAIFISSPRSITPYHLDAEYNFLLQIRGQKTISVFDPSDRTLLSEQELEEHHCQSVIHRNMVFKAEFQEKAQVFELTPGYALHVPSLAPHWVKNGDTVSISFSAAFVTHGFERKNSIFKVNRWLRRQGLNPSPPGESRIRDQVKLSGYRAWRRLSSWRGNSK